MYKKILLCLMLCLVLCGCSRGYKMPEDAASETIGSGREILCSQQIKPGMEIVIYRDQNNSQLGCGLERKVLGRWYWDNGTAAPEKITEDDREMAWSSQNFRNLILGTVPVVYGIALDNRISRVTVTMDNKKTIEANVINTIGGAAVWYISGKGVGKPQVIKGIAKNSQLLYYYPPRN